MADSQEMQQSRDIRPIPDPTVLTTAASERLEAMIRNLIKTEIEHQAELFDQKLARVETQFQMLEFRLGEQKRDAEARTAEQKKDTKDALDAALAAQKEAGALQTSASEKSITKSETATNERIKAVETLLATSTKASDDKVDDLKSRIVAIEATRLGSVEQIASVRAGNVDVRGNLASIVSVITAVIAVASIIITIIVVTKP